MSVIFQNQKGKLCFAEKEAYFNFILYIYIFFLQFILLYVFMHLGDAFIQSDLQAVHFLSVCVYAGNWTHNLLRC